MGAPVDGVGWRVAESIVTAEAAAGTEGVEDDAMEDRLVGHDDGLAEDGVRRLRRPPDWDQTVDGSGVETIAALLPDSAPRIDDQVDIDGQRFRVLNVTPRLDIPKVPGLLPPAAQHHALDLELVGDSPYDPLLPRARALIERRGGAVERLSAAREGLWRHVSIHAEVRWPGRTIEVYGAGGSDHQALGDLDSSLEQLGPGPGRASASEGARG